MASQLFEIIKELISSFLLNKAEGKVGAEISIPFDGPATNQDSDKTNDTELSTQPIDWADAKCQITQHFTVGDAITLHAWNRLANENDGLTEDGKNKLIILCNKMEEVRTYLGCPINVHCMFRSQEYNKEIVKAIPNDVHAQFLAIDLDCGNNLSIEQVKSKMEPVLEKMSIRMEKGTTTWVHLDLREPGPSGRYFTA